MKLTVCFILIAFISLAKTENNGFKSPKGRVLQSGTAIRIFVDYSDADNQWKSSTLQDKYIFSKKLMAKTVDFYSLFLKVRDDRRKDTYTWSDVKVDDSKTLGGRTVAYDLYTYFKAYNRVDNSFAAAAPLSFDSFGRAVVGTFQLNLNAITPSKANMINHFGTFVHEFYHILVFNDELFSRFINAAGTPQGRSNLVVDSITLGGKQRTGYKGTNVLTWAKNYLGDANLGYVLMENDGGSGSAGSHWEHMYWPTEFMSPIDTTPSLHTQLSFNMAVDSGWYVVDLSLAEELTYGKGANNGFQSGACPTGSGFCTAADATAGKITCSPDRRYKAKCYTDPTYSENCYFLFSTAICSIDDTATYGSNVDASFELLGPDSKCVMTKKLGNEADFQAACSKASCDNSNDLTFTFKSGASCSCPSSKDGQVVNCNGGGTNAKITCPTVSERTDLCQRLSNNKKCPNDCNGNGICLGDFSGSAARRCFCMYGYTGPGCADANLNELESKITTWATATPTLLKKSLISSIMTMLLLSTFFLHL